MSGSPNYASTPTVGAAALTVANSGTRAVPAGGSTVFTPGASGGMVERIVISLRGTLAAQTTVLLYRVIGGVHYLYEEIQIAAATIAAGTENASVTMEAVTTPQLVPIAMPAGSTLVAVLSVAAANGINVQCEGGSY